MSDGQPGAACPQCGSAAAVHSIAELAAFAQGKLNDLQGAAGQPWQQGPQPGPAAQPQFGPMLGPGPLPGDPGQPAPGPGSAPGTPSQSVSGPPGTGAGGTGAGGTAQPQFGPMAGSASQPEFGPMQGSAAQPQFGPMPGNAAGPGPGPFPGNPAGPGPASGAPQPQPGPTPGWAAQPRPRNSQSGGIGGLGDFMRGDSSIGDDLAGLAVGAAARFIGRAISRRVQQKVTEQVLPAAARGQEMLRAQVEIAQRHPDLRACLSDKVIFLAGGSRVLPMSELHGMPTVEQADALVARLRNG